MRRFPALFLILLCSCGGGAPEEAAVLEGVEFIELGTDAAFDGIYFVDENNGFIAGGAVYAKGGLIGRTHDGGETWEFQSGVVKPTPKAVLFTLADVYFVNERVGCAVAFGGTIIRTDDGGTTWNSVRHRTGVRHLFDIDFVDEYRGWAVGLHGVIHTGDGGLTWERIDSDEDDVSAHAIDFIDMSHGWVAGQHGLMRRTFDGGYHWERVSLFEDDDKPYLYEMQFLDASHGWMVGGESTILATRDGGETWVAQECGVPAFFTAVQFVDPLRGWVVGYNRHPGISYLVRTSDGGETWRLVTSVRGEELRALAVVGDTGWAVGDRTHEGAQTLLRFDASPDSALASL
jgi:photosystem II stability/assembly factor-like uncharacterized protein